MSVSLPEMVITYLAEQHGWSNERARNAQQMVQHCMDDGASEQNVCALILEVNNLVNLTDDEFDKIRQWYEASQATSKTSS